MIYCVLLFHYCWQEKIIECKKQQNITADNKGQCSRSVKRRSNPNRGRSIDGLVVERGGASAPSGFDCDRKSVAVKKIYLSVFC